MYNVGDYGLSGRNGISDYLGIIMETITDPSEVRYGDWQYQGDCEFYVSDNNLTIIRSDGEWVSTFPLTEPGTIDYINSLPILYKK